MPTNRVPSRFPVLASRWTARLLSLAVAGVIIAFLGEGTPKREDWLPIACFPVGLLVGLGLAWWREVAGGCVAIASMATFYVICYATSGKIPTGPYLAILASPAALFLIAGVLARAGGDKAPSTLRPG